VCAPVVLMPRWVVCVVAGESEQKSERFGVKCVLKGGKWIELKIDGALCRGLGSATNTDYTEGEPEEMNNAVVTNIACVCCPKVVAGAMQIAV